MKQYVRRALLAFSMIICLFSLTACSTTEGGTGSAGVDASIADYASQVSESLLQDITSFVDLEEAKTVEESLRAEKQAVQTVLADALVSWTGIMDETGVFIGILNTEVDFVDDQYICVINAEFAQRQLEFKAIYEMGDSSLNPIAISFTPEYSLGETLAKAGMNTLMGMGTVFLVLIFMSFLIAQFKHVNTYASKAVVAQPVVVPVAAPVVEVTEEVEELADDLELVAVITAAIAASEGTSADGLVVRSIKRVQGAKWKRA